MSLLICKPGLITTVQDTGRQGYRASGVPPGGAMDLRALRLANLACGNPAHTPALEFTLHGAVMVAETTILLAVAGGGATLYVNDTPVPYNRPCLVPASSLLECRYHAQGCRLYLAVGGGFALHPELGSCSTYIPAALGGLGGRALRSGDRLPFAAPEKGITGRIAKMATRRLGALHTTPWGICTPVNLVDTSCLVRVLPGPEWEDFPESMRQTFMTSRFRITDQSDRMGYRLRGPALQTVSDASMASGAVAPGTLQVTPDGNLLLLMADAQTTGGYPRIAQVVMADLPACAQCRPGIDLQFDMISLEEAEALYLMEQRAMRRLERAIDLRCSLVG